VTTATIAGQSQRRPLHRTLYFWVLVGIVLGVLTGWLAPSFGVALEPVGLSFVNLIKMVIAPIIFCTVVTGIASMESMKQVGRVGGKALLYFEALTTLALILGLVVVNVVKPGEGIHADPTKIKVTEKVGGFIAQGEGSHWYDFIFHIFPSSMVGAFADGDVIQVLFISIVFAFALHTMGERGRPITRGIENIGQALFGIVRIVMYAAPIGAFGAMAFTIGKYGLSTLTNLGQLILTFYATAIFFVVVILGLVVRACGLSIFKLLRYLRSELLVVLGTSSSESVLPQLMRKLEHLGCPKPVVGLTVPAGYSFNLDGTCIYLTLAAIFVAQAQDVQLGIGSQIAVVLVLLLTSKGAAGVTGSGFIVLAATLSALGTIPVAGLMLVFGIDKFMSECRALTNLCGNAVASIVVSKWEGQFDLDRARRVLDGDDLSDLELLVVDDTLVTERMDADALAALTATSTTAPASTRLDANGHKATAVAVLERELPAEDVYPTEPDVRVPASRPRPRPTASASRTTTTPRSSARSAATGSTPARAATTRTAAKPDVPTRSRATKATPSAGTSRSATGTRTNRG
jgi:aerobic C4-dicarboxylate transport protein